MSTPESVSNALEDYQAWLKRNPGIDLFDYATLAVPPDSFVAVLEILDPDLVEHNGAYFRAREFTVDAYDVWARKLASVAQIQRVMNHVHMSQFFRERKVPYRVLEFLGAQIAKHWSRAFAERGLKAASFGDGVDVEVTLFGAEEGQP